MSKPVTATTNLSANEKRELLAKLLRQKAPEY